MFKKLLKFLLMSALTFFLMIVFLLVVAALTMGPTVKKNSILVLDLSGPLFEEGPQGWKERLLVGDVLTTRGIVESVEKAKKDDRIRGLLVNSLYAEMGIGKAQELRNVIRDFARTSKKPVYGYMEEGGTIDYYVCAAAPRLFASPEGDSWFTLLGIRAEVPFFKGTLNKVGIEAQLDHIGAYKSGSDIYTRETMSDPDREAVNSILDSLYSRVTSDIAMDRKLTPEHVKNLIDQAPFLAKDLKEKHLVDDLLYRDEMEDLIKKELKLVELNTVSILEYQKPTFSETFEEKKDKIAIVYATGSIMPGTSSKGWGENIMGSTTITEALHQARDNDAVKAVVMRVDSPGGSPSASDAIWREVRVTARKKPVVVSMADVAASGGYYISMGATKIFADPSTFTGSIGIYGGKFYLKGLYDKIGLKKEIIKRGENADLFSDYVPFREKEWELIRKHMQFTYDTFTRKAAEGRKRTNRQIQDVAQGRVWSGEQGLQLGLVDKLGGLKDAIQEAKQLAKLSGKSVGFVIYPARREDLSNLFSSSRAKVQLPEEVHELLCWAQITRKEHLLLLMPIKFIIN